MSPSAAPPDRQAPPVTRSGRNLKISRLGSMPIPRFLMTSGSSRESGALIRTNLPVKVNDMSLRREFGLALRPLSAQQVWSPLRFLELKLSPSLTVRFPETWRSNRCKYSQTQVKVSNDLRPLPEEDFSREEGEVEKHPEQEAWISVPCCCHGFSTRHIGEDVITLLGKSIKLPSGANGRLAIRSAMVGAALGW